MFELNYFILFFLFFNIITSSLGLIYWQNPVHSLLGLIFIFINFGILLIIFDFEFLGLIYIIIYGGAIAVLFVFAIMTLDLRNLKQRLYDKNITLYSAITFISLVVGLIAVNFEEITQLSDARNKADKAQYLADPAKEVLLKTNSTDSISLLLYTYYAPLFIIAGVLLLFAMLSSISLVRQPVSEKTQDTYKQIFKKMKKSVFLKDK